jgi:putative ABC transport system permease protein
MIRNYLKIGYRSILKHKQSSIINSVGLGIAFSTCLILFVFLDRLYNMDTCHEHADRKYLIESVIENDGQDRIFGNTPLALASAIKADIPEVENAVRMQYTSADFRYEDKVFSEQVIFADNGFLDIFSFDLLAGPKNVLEDRGKIVLSKNIAKKYFGDETAIGKQVSLLFSVKGKEYKETYLVGAVADDFDYLTSIRFQILVPFENRRNLGLIDDEDWENYTNATFVTLRQSDHQEHVLNQLNAYTGIQNEANPDRKIAHFLLDPLLKMTLNASGKEAMLVYKYPPVARIVLTIIAVFILILAVFNYINISIVSATSRLKEIGLRKTIGGSRKQIILQFIFENTLLCFLAIVFGYMLTVGFMLPGFNSIMDASNPMILDVGNPRLWIFISALFLLVSFGSAAYPAFFISAFRPVHILKGELKLTSKNYFTKSLLTVQLIISFITISLGTVFVLNNSYIEKRDWGYNKEQSIIVPLVNNDQYSSLKDVFTQYPNVTIVSGSQNRMGYWMKEDVIEYDSKEYVSKSIMAGYEYLDVLGFRLKKGRFFENYSMNDMKEALVVNEAFVHMLELDEPIGARVMLNEKAHFIVGVTEDFHFMHFGHDIKPLLFKVSEETDFRYLAIRTAVGKAKITEEYVEDTWKNMYPDNTYEGYFQNTTFDNYYRQNKGVSKLMVAIAGIAVLIACMGLFGLVSLFISKKVKEFGIRKVLGASSRNIGMLIGKGFAWVIVISTILGAPLAFLMSNSIVESLFKYHLPMNATPFVITGIILILTTILTISSQVFKALSINPAEQLRDQ